jgi:predicted phage terminase large subunit-like protein
VSKKTELNPFQIALAQNNLTAFSEWLGYRNASFHKRIYEVLSDDSIKNAIFIVPPRHGKSTCVSVNYPLWRLGRDPNRRIIVASHTKEFVASFLREIKQWMASPRYIELFGDLKPTHTGLPGKWTLNEIIVQRDRIQKDPSITALGMEQALIGRGADDIIADDIVDEDWVSSETMRETLRTKFRKELLTRREPGGRVLVVGSRFSYLDLYSELLEEEQYEKIVLPAIDDKDQILWPARWPKEELVKKKNEVGSIIFAAQYLCNPTPAEGAIFKDVWLTYWHEKEDRPDKRLYRLPARSELDVFQGWDLSISEDPEADYTVGLTLGMHRASGRGFVLDYTHQHLNFPAQVKAVETQALAWLPLKVGIESVAYQKALPQQVRREMKLTVPIVDVHQDRNKTTRMIKISALMESQMLAFSLKHDDLILECLQFPKGKHDDILDALEIAVRIASSYAEPGASLFIPPSTMPRIEAETDRERFLRAARRAGSDWI